MTQAIIKPKLTYQDYLTYDDGTDTRYELVDGELVAKNQPRAKHSQVGRFLYRVLDDAITRTGESWIVCWDYGVRTGVKQSRIPDLTVITEAQEDSLIESDSEAVLEEPPILAIEIVSPNDPTTDYRDKRSEYAVKGIPEYWIVDPRNNRITVLTLVNGFYQEAIFEGNDRIISGTFPDLNLTASQVFIPKKSSGNVNAVR